MAGVSRASRVRALDPIEVLELRSDRDWARLTKRYIDERPREPIANLAPWRRSLEVAREVGAKSVVIEKQYHCKDYRSEYVSSYAHQLHPPAVASHRLHFFGSLVRRDDLTDLANRRYLGYIVCRPPSLPIVGRTMLIPPRDLRASIRTWARETVHLFGQPLEVRAAPFMQQDNQVDICAHVCAWMVHFTMFLREREVARAVIAEFPIRTGSFANPARPVQGDGVTARDAERLLAALGLPSQPIDCGVSDDGLEPLEPLPYPWGPQRPWELPDFPRGDSFSRRSIGELACRYLNSGYPLYVDIGGHSVVVCGYQAADDPDRHMIYFGHDDSSGPYVELPDPRGPKDAWEWIVCPLPEQVALTPRAAESVALAKFQEAFDLVTAESVGRSGTEDWGVDRVAALMNRGVLKRRTYLVQANEWKRDLALRGMPNQLVKLYSELPMSRHICVTEFVERRGDRPSSEVVRGEVVLDATANEHNFRVLALRIGNLVTCATSADHNVTSMVPNARAQSGARGADIW